MDFGDLGSGGVSPAISCVARLGNPPTTASFLDAPSDASCGDKCNMAVRQGFEPWVEL